MSAPFYHLLVENAFGDRTTREIDSHYHIQSLANSSEAITAYLADSLRLQAIAASSQSAMLQEQGITNDSLAEVVAEMAYLGAGVHDLTGVVQDGFAQIGATLLHQQAVLTEIADLLRQRYTAEARELRDEAHKWLRMGMSRSGPERKEDWADSLRLYREVVKNPIGNQDFVAWFHIGWLLWKHDRNLPEAEQAFARSSRLSTESHPLHFALSIRHCAQMQYLQGRFEDAHTTQWTYVLEDDPEALFDATRYMAKTGRTTEVPRYLDRCIQRCPTFYVRALAESDFRPMAEQLHAWAAAKRDEARQLAQGVLEQLPAVVEQASAWQAEHDLDGITTAHYLAEQSDYLKCVESERIARSALCAIVNATERRQHLLRTEFMGLRTRASGLLDEMRSNAVGSARKTLQHADCEIAGLCDPSSHEDYLAGIECWKQILALLATSQGEVDEYWNQRRVESQFVGGLFGGLAGAVIGGIGGILVGIVACIGLALLLLIPFALEWISMDMCYMAYTMTFFGMISLGVLGGAVKGYFAGSAKAKQMHDSKRRRA